MMDVKFEEFKELFPAGTKIININGTREKFEAIVRCRCKDKEDFLENWLKPYELLNNVGLRTCVTRPRTGKVVLYKAIYRCQHNTYPNSHVRNKKAHKKHTGCQAVLKVTIKASAENRRRRSKDYLWTEYPTVIAVVHNHNHDLNDLSDNLFLHKRIKLSEKAVFKEETNEDNNCVFEDVTLCDVNNMDNYVYEELVVTEGSQVTVEEKLDEINSESSCKLHELFVFKSDTTDVDESLIWSNLKEKFDSLFRSWESNKCKARCQALQAALAYLEKHDKFSTPSYDAIHSHFTIGKTIDKPESLQASDIVIIDCQTQNDIQKVEQSQVSPKRESDDQVIIQKCLTSPQNFSEIITVEKYVQKCSEVQMSTVEEFSYQIEDESQYNTPENVQHSFCKVIGIPA
ncbi:uncharacterized protein LOC142326236 [Lycorma delicatula]|uniref:uncharacterized protein LOC142326236 n=1 Tax=Lycorma delicatula TaxID=130591 RepID=UPI003F5180C3